MQCNGLHIVHTVHSSLSEGTCELPGQRAFIIFSSMAPSSMKSVHIMESLTQYVCLLHAFNVPW